MFDFFRIRIESNKLSLFDSNISNRIYDIFENIRLKIRIFSNNFRHILRDFAPKLSNFEVKFQNVSQNCPLLKHSLIKYLNIRHYSKLFDFIQNYSTLFKIIRHIESNTNLVFDLKIEFMLNYIIHFNSIRK